MLAQGIVPAALIEQAPLKPASWTIGRCIAEYIRNNPVPVSDVKLLDTIRPGLELSSTRNLNDDWADGWISSMKREANLAPSTIRHRHGALARCFDWMLRKHPDVLAQNPLRHQAGISLKKIQQLDGELASSCSRPSKRT